MATLDGNGWRRCVAWLAGSGILAILLLPGCAEHDAGLRGEHGGASVGGAPGAAELHQPIANVTGVNVSVWNPGLGLYEVIDVPLTQQPDLTWQGTLLGLPRHAALTYEADGLVGTVVDFMGDTTAAIGMPTGTVGVALQPVTGTTFTMAKVTAITNPSPVQRGNSANFVFFVQGDSNETLTWTITAGGGGGAQFASPKTGTLTLDASGAGSHTHVFNAPNAGGPNAIHVNTHSFEITDAEGVTFRAYFVATSCDLAGGVVC